MYFQEILLDPSGKNYNKFKNISKSFLYEEFFFFFYTKDDVLDYDF